MRMLKRVFDFYINCSIHLGIAVFALTSITQLSLKIPIIENLNETIFFGTILGYNFLKYSSVFSFKFFNQNKYLDVAIVCFIAFVAFLYFFIPLNLKMQIAFLKIGVLVLIYPFLRKYGLLKIFYVSFCVTLITVYLPVFLLNFWGFDSYVTFIQRFLIVISLLIPFEIRDSLTDELRTKTLPQRFGINATKLFGILLIVPFMTMEFLKANFNYLVLPIGVLIALLIQNTSFKRTKYYTSFWVESVPILWLILML
ncbi:MAG TPA: hypothetical protein VN192_07205 [Flavobacterium sp.]|nr:hypothetical protein [Flavobacterium sp.]